MFVITLAGENRFYLSCSDADMGKVYKLVKQTDDERLQKVYVCGLLESILRSGIENYVKK